MHVQQERVDAFYTELKECINEWNTSRREEMWQLCGNTTALHPDQLFLYAHTQYTDIADWLRIISQRMSNKNIRDTIFDPFFSIDTYTANVCWFKLAFDLAKMLNQSHITWFSICFPDIKPYDPISFRPLLHTMPILLYKVKRLPTLGLIPDERIINLYFPNVKSPYPSYVYEEQNQQLYRFVPQCPDVLSKPSFSFYKIQIDKTSEFNERLDQICQFYKKSHKKLATPFSKQQNSAKKISSANTLYLAKNRTHSLSPEMISYSPKLSPLPVVERKKIREEELVLPKFVRTFNLDPQDMEFSEQESDLMFEVPEEKSSPLLENFSPYTQKDKKRNLELEKFFTQEILDESRDLAFYFLDSQQLEYLITDCGGYPWFDLRGYALNNNATLAYPLSSLFYPRFIPADYYSLTKFWHNNSRFPGDIEIFDSDSSFFKDKRGYPLYKLKPHHYAMYPYFAAIKRSPLSFRELHRMTWKDGAFFYYHQGDIYVNSNQYVQNVLMLTWHDSGSVPKMILPSLLEIFEYFFTLYHQEIDDLSEFRERLNQWSLKDHFYPCDPYEQQDRFFFYAQMVSENYGSNSVCLSHNTFLELFDHCFYLPIEEVYYDVLNMARWISAFAPHFISSNVYFDIIYNDLKIARKFDYLSFIDGLKSLLLTAPDGLAFQINRLINLITSIRKIKAKHIDAMTQIYKDYDQYVRANLEFDHVKPQLSGRAAWQHFAQVLAGAGLIRDPVKLCCPDIKELREPLTSMLFSTFDFCKLIFTKNRTALSALDSSKRAARRYSLFYNVVSDASFKEALATHDPERHQLSAPLHTPTNGFALNFTPEEIESLEAADQRYQQYLSLSYDEYGGKKLLLSTCLLLRYLVEIIMSQGPIEPTEPRFVQEKYEIRVIRSYSEIPAKSVRIFKKYMNEFMLLFLAPSSAAVRNKIIIYIKLHLAERKISCFTQEGVLKEEIFLSALQPVGMAPITTKTLPNYFTQIIAYLEKKQRIGVSNPMSLHTQGLEAYKIFNRTYQHLSSYERYALDTREITLNGVTKCFKEVIQDGHFCMMETGVWLMVFLLSIDPSFKFHTRYRTCEVDMDADAEQKLEPIFKEARKNSFNLSYRNTAHEAEKLFISLMITKFGLYPLGNEDEDIDKDTDEDKNELALLESYSFHDCVNLIPLYLAENIFTPIINVLSSDYEKLGEIYVDILKNHLYEAYYNHMTQLRMINYSVIQRQNRWIGEVLKGDVGNSINIHTYYWFQTVYLHVNLEHLLLPSQKHDLYVSFKNILKIPAPYQRLVANIKYLYFLRELSTEEFLKFWGEIDIAYRKDVFIDYLSSQGQLINEASLARSTRQVFKNELDGLPKLSRSSPYFYNSEQSVFEGYIRQLTAIIPPSVGRQSSTSPWNYF